MKLNGILLFVLAECNLKHSICVSRYHLARLLLLCQTLNLCIKLISLEDSLSNQKTHTKNEPRDRTHAPHIRTTGHKFFVSDVRFGDRFRGQIATGHIYYDLFCLSLDKTTIGRAFLGIWSCSLGLLFIITREHAIGLASSSSRSRLKI